MQTVSIDIKRLARDRTPSQPRHTLLPPQVLTFTRHWLSLAGETTPRWPQFDMLDVAEAVPYLAVFKCRGELAFDVTFVGSAVTAMTDGDLHAGQVIVANSILGDIDWVSRARTAVDFNDVQLATSTVNLPSMSAMDVVAAAFPFLGDVGSAVEYVACITLPRLN